MTETSVLPAETLASAPRGLRAGLFLLIATFVLFPLGSLPPLYASVCVGFLGPVAVILCLLYKYRGRFPLNMENCFLASAAIQYLFAPAVIRMITGNFTASYWKESASRAYVKNFYGQAMLVTLVFCAAVLLASGFFRGPWPQKLVRGRIAVVFSRRTLFILIFMIVNLWAARAALLSAGAYYHVVKTKFAETDAYSALAQVDDGFGKMVIAYLWTGVFASGYALVLAVPYTLLDVAWNFIGGGREPIVVAMIIIGLSSYICKNRIPWKFIAIVTFPLLILVGFMGSFRYQANTMAKDTIDLHAVVAAIRNETEDVSEKPSFFVTALIRFSDLDSIAPSMPGRPNSSHTCWAKPGSEFQKQ